MNEKQREFIVSIIRIIVGIILAGMAGGKFLGKELEIYQYIVMIVISTLLTVIGTVMLRR